MASSLGNPTSAIPAGPPPAGRGRSVKLLGLGLGSAGAVLLLAGGAWFFLIPSARARADRLAQALALIDDGKPEEARNFAKGLEAAGYDSPDFRGGVEFVLGVAAFQMAEASPEADRRSQYTVAATYLREAEQQGLSDERRPLWCFAYGKCLFALGDLQAARPLLEEAVASHPERRVAAAEMLAELYFDPEERTPERLTRALELFDLVLKETDGSTTQQEAALLLRGELLVTMGRYEDAEAIVRELTQSRPGLYGAAILSGLVLIGQKRYDEAIKRLRPLMDTAGVDDKSARQATFLAGYAAELRADELAATPAEGTLQRGALQAEQADYRQQAVDAYQKTIDRFERTIEGQAAYVHIARLQMEVGAHEKALQSFGAALRMVPGPDEHHNRWLKLEQFRVRVLAAWNAWNQSSRFAEAIGLAELMTPLFPREQAYDLAARSRQRAAEDLAAELERSSATVRAQRTPELARLWRDSGAAFAKLAQVRQHARDYADALWTSTDHYYRGHDHDTALKKINEYLESPPESMQPLALVRRGMIHLDLDQIDAAVADFNQVITANPTSPAAFHAQYLLGVCEVERDHPQAAEAAWRMLLVSTQLTPAAGEWRDALFALAKLQCDLAAREHRQTLCRTGTVEETNAAWARMQEYAAASTKSLEEYVARYPNSPQISEAQYVLGKSLELQAEWQQRQWELAETENARQQAKRLREQILNRALVQFEELKDRLTHLNREDQLSPTGRTLLANAWFDLPATYFRLGLYEQAITAYSDAANQFPQDVRVLTAYMQMAQAFSLSGKSIEARSMLEQAQVILDQRQIPDAAFVAPTTSLTRAEWNEWLDRARQVQR
jgi:tetratricopeptide (TPR) repeat protein